MTESIIFYYNLHVYESTLSVSIIIVWTAEHDFDQAIQKKGTIACDRRHTSALEEAGRLKSQWQTIYRQYYHFDI